MQTLMLLLAMSAHVNVTQCMDLSGKWVSTGDDKSVIVLQQSGCERLSFSNGVDPARVLRIDGAYLKCSDLGWQCEQTVALFQNQLDEDVHLFILRYGVPVTTEGSQETELCNGEQQIWLADGDLLVKDQIKCRDWSHTVELRFNPAK